MGDVLAETPTIGNNEGSEERRRTVREISALQSRTQQSQFTAASLPCDLQTLAGAP